MAQLFANNISTTLASACTAAATSIVVNSATGLPSPGSADWFYLTLATPTTPETAWEVVKVTGVSGTTLTVVRGQDATTAVAWAALTRVELRPCAAGMKDMLGAGLTLALATPPAIGATTPAAITGTTITATSAFSGPGTGLTGTAASLTAGAANAVAWANVTGKPNLSASTYQWNWSGQGGQPPWLWGGSDGTNMYVYNPANFTVNAAYYLLASSIGGNLYSGSRGSGGTYTNTTGRVLWVYLFGSNSGGSSNGSTYIYLNGTNVGQINNYGQNWYALIPIPIGYTYKFTVSNSTLTGWYEM